MKYMLLIYSREVEVAGDVREQFYIDSTQLARDLIASGKFLGASPLNPTSMATSVRLRDGKFSVIDGPFAETREQLGGYYLINAGDLDEAIDIATRVPAVRWGTVEVRPVIELNGLP